jgi:hypothetical protein
MNMKTNVTSKVHLDERLLNEIQNQVKETIATGVALEVGRNNLNFGVADLWNIHKQKRKRSSRRFL